VQINKQKDQESTDTDNNGETADSDASQIIENELPKITRDQMIHAIQQEILILEDELKHLASERALAVKGAILADGTIDPKRIFTIEAKTLEPEEQDKSIDSGSVIMTLK